MTGLTGKTRFDSTDFMNVVNTIDRLTANGKNVHYFDGLKDGTVLYNLVCINTPSDVFFWKKLSQYGISVVGIPKTNGTKNEICISHSLMLRESASDEEKEIAKEFLGMLWDKEVQLKMSYSPNFHFSVRKDVMREQIGAVAEGTFISMSFFETEYDFVLEEPDYNTTIVFMERIMDNSIPVCIFEEEYKAILEEEFSDYYEGKLTRELLIEHLKSRVEIYFSEKG